MNKKATTNRITLNEVSKNFGTKILFENVTATFNPGNRYGLTGPNGAGKSTLLKIITGQEEPTTGSVILPNRVGILRQNIEDFRDAIVLDVVIMGSKRLWDALQERDALYNVEMTDAVGMRFGDLESIIAEENGYSADTDAEILLQGMGIAKEYFKLPMHSIPLDMQFRVLLCQALFGDPDALLLDEPTNHLDLESINWLEKFLFDYKGTLVVISHNRHFLNSVTTHIADIDYETIILYTGNYDDMVMAKTSVRDRAEHDAKSKEKKIAQLKEFIAKFGAGTRASQVQSRAKEIGRLQPQELKQSNIQRPYIRLLTTEKQPGKIVISAESISMAYEDNSVIKNFSIEISRGDKVGIIGNNGRGKTTLLKMLSFNLQPTKGKVELGHQAIISYFPQNHAEMVLKQPKETSFEWLKERRPGIYDQDIRSVMGKMLFGGDDAFKQVSTLSGGETARLIIAGMMLADHNVIILDEPDNHLDLEAVSALGAGLSDYKGTVLLASHDRDLIDSVATKIIAFEPEGIVIHDGSYEEYKTKRSEAMKR